MEINFMFHIFMLERFFKLNFVTVLPSPSRSVYYSNCKLMITFLNCFSQKIWWMKRGSCIKHIILDRNKYYQSYFSIILGDMQHKYWDWKLWTIVLYSRFDTDTVLFGKAYVDFFGFQQNSTLKRIFSNTFCHFCKKGNW